MINQFAVLIKNDVVKNMVVGLGISIVVPIAVNLLAPVIRPLARSTLKAGILAYEKGRETVAEIGEVLDDLVAEVQEELQEATSLEVDQISDDSPAQGGEAR